MESSNVCFSFNDFKDSISKTWSQLRNESQFSDVTLACSDQQVEAHKVIISARSPVLRNILMHNTHPHPLIYFKDLSSTDLIGMLNYIYLGQATIQQDNLHKFLSLADELQIEGLTQKYQISLKENEKSKQVIYSYKNDHILNDTDMFEITKTVDIFNGEKSLNEIKMESVDTKKNTLKTKDLSINSLNKTSTAINNCDECDYKTQQKCNLNRHKNLKHNKGGKMSSIQKDVSGGSKTKFNGEKSFKAELRKEIRAGSIDTKKRMLNAKALLIESGNRNIKIVKCCDQCDFKTQQTCNLNRHKKLKHGEFYFDCESCDYSTKNKSRMKSHELSMHQGIRYFCKLCDYIGKEKLHLKRHIRSSHEGIKYSCQQCNYKATSQGNLNRHKRSLHLNLRYYCEFCVYTAGEKYALRSHIQETHERN